jgi:hypothetical protein
MGGEGVWLRCSRCGQVFFEENRALAEAPEPPSAQDLPPGAGGAGWREEAGRLTEPETPPQPAETELEGTVLIPTPGAFAGDEDRSTPVPDIGIEAHSTDPLPGEGEEGPAIEKDVDDDADAPTVEPRGRKAGSESAGEGGEDGSASPPRKRRRGLLWTLVVILILTAAAGAFFWFAPEAGRRIVDATVAAVPSAAGLFGGGTAKDQSMNLRTLEVADVRQRFVNNWVIGELRIVEGSVVNHAKHAVTEVRVRARHYDAAGMIVGEKTAYCGNLLTDEELGTLAEAEIERELSNPRGSDASNEKIEPEGRIPFMVVFVRLPAGISRSTVSIAGAERLLP